MKIEKTYFSHTVEFIAPEVKNFANAHPAVEDPTSYALRQNRQLQELLSSKHATISEIRKIANDKYDIITNNGHIIPVDIVFAPYKYAYRFQSLSWDGGVYNMFDG